MKTKNYMASHLMLMISIIGLIGAIFLNSSSHSQKPENFSKVASSKEIRAVWVPGMSLNFAEKSAEAFEANFDEIIRKSKERGINTLVVHVRPYSDSLYPSKYFPWSHILTGEQGVSPGFDPLKYMIAATHNSGLKFHAWVNPLRIQLNGIPARFCAENPFVCFEKDKEKKLCVCDVCEGYKIYNPATEEARELIINGIQEIAQNYDVDAIQIDDYFYPCEDGDFDKECYEKYCNNLDSSTAPSKQDFHIQNINTLIRGIYSAIKSANPNVQFGIAPQGNIGNDIKMGADVRTWGRSKGYADYLCPELYYNSENPHLKFEDAAKQWREIVTEESIDLYFGLGVYKAGSNVDNGTWKNKGDILAKQINYGRELGCNGFMLFSYDYLVGKQAEEEVANVIKLFE